jgi:GTP cyclohydrolase II
MSKITIKERFGQAPVELLNRTDLSFKAKGLFSFIQSKPDGWSFSVDRITRQSNEGKDAIRSGLKELEDAGYLTRIAAKKKDGTWDGYDYTLSAFPLADFPSTVNSMTENPDTYSKIEDSKIDIVKKSIVLQNAEKATASRGVSRGDTAPSKKALKTRVVKKELASHEDIIAALDAVKPLFPSEFANPTRTPYGNKTTRGAVAAAISAYGLQTVVLVASKFATLKTTKYSHTAINVNAFFVRFDAIKTFVEKEQGKVEEHNAPDVLAQYDYVDL